MPGFYMTKLETLKVGHIALKSASPQVRKLFFVVPQRKLSLSKAQLLSLCFKILDSTLIMAFMNGFGMVKLI
jgi:hypothetical protein